MDALNHALLVGAVLMFAGILLGGVSARFGLPALLVFLVVGMLGGEDGPGGIVFDDYGTSVLVGNLALAVILLDGGLRTRYATFRVALGPSLSLATVGVLITAGLLGASAAWLLGVDWRLGLLLGAVVGSTDAAAVFSLLRAGGVRLNDRVAAALELESGLNDPMAVFLTLTLVAVLSGQMTEPATALPLALFMQFGLGLAAGVGFGRAIGWVQDHARVGEGLQALLLASAGVLVFALTNALGGSGFLAVYLVGLTVGNRERPVGEGALRAMDGLAWLAQSGMFLLLGLLVAPREGLAVAGPALLLAGILMLVARPLAVWLTLLPFRFAAREVAFIAWVGLRGAVPIVLALFPLLAGLEGAELVFNITFYVVLLSLLLQGTSLAWVARRLKVCVPPRPEPFSSVPLDTGAGEAFALVQYRVLPESRAAGHVPATLRLPERCEAVAVFRGGLRFTDLAALRLEVGDIVSLLAPAAFSERLAEWFRSDTGPFAAREVYGDFTLDAGARVADVVSFYNAGEVPAPLAAATLAEALERLLHHRAVEGDEVVIGNLHLTVREMVNGEIRKVGLKLLRPAE